MFVRAATIPSTVAGRRSDRSAVARIVIDGVDPVDRDPCGAVAVVDLGFRNDTSPPEIDLSVHSVGKAIENGASNGAAMRYEPGARCRSMSDAPRRTVSELAEGEAAGSGEDDTDVPAAIGSALRPNGTGTSSDKRPDGQDDDPGHRMAKVASGTDHGWPSPRNRNEPMKPSASGSQAQDLGRAGPDQDEDRHAIDVRNGEAGRIVRHGVVPTDETLQAARHVDVRPDARQHHGQRWSSRQGRLGQSRSSALQRCRAGRSGTGEGRS